MKQQRKAVRTRKRNLGRAGRSRSDRQKAGQALPPRDARYAALKYTDEIIKGKISINSRGFGFVTPEGMQKNQADIFISKDELHTAMNGDVVQVQLAQAIAGAAADGHAREGRVTEVLERANSRIVGIYSASRRFGFVAPDDTRLKADIYIPEGQAMDAVTGSKVVAEVTSWPDGKQKAEGRIIEVIGQKGEPGVDILSIMRQYDLSEGFPEEVQAAADAVEQTINAEEHLGQNGREDRRHLKIVTIDGEDAKDLDDGVYVEKRPDGSFFLGVYIADVSWYVREQEPLDVEAEARGTSVYLVDRVVPMLPKALSNGICSLNAGVDRLSMACEMSISAEGKVTDYRILPVVIHVYRRLTYTLVNKILVENDKEFTRDNEDIVPFLRDLQEVRNAMYRYRHRRGAINFEIPEIKVKLDEDGRAVGLKKRVGNLGESIIEQCMLAANETVAEHMCRRKQPFVYRVHEEPEESKVTALNGLLNTFGLHLKTASDGSIKPKDLQVTLEKIAGGPAEKIVSTVALRSMQQARYAAENLGHFGLAAQYYTHFTSPIRRYPDLMVHRLLRESFATGSIPKEKREKIIEKLAERAEHASQRERVAVNAERDTTDLKKVEYMQQFVGDTFEGIISSVTSFGFFVELDNGVEGLVHMTTLKDDYYDYIESQYALVGTHHKRRYQLGDTVEILLARADVEARSLDFLVKDNCDPRALQMQDSADRAESGSAAKAKGRTGRKGRVSGKESKKAKQARSGREDTRKAAERTGRKKNKKDKHSKRKGKRRSGSDVIASFDPLTI
ncbi:ribonuclease R [Anaerovibrio sp.]|uniref:ribonuclease R n=1 Tax=Anaerovibrio sp. TaxID=1872532 RepID=UPI003F1424BB